MNYEKKDFSPSPKLLPFGGFDVAALLNAMHNSANSGSTLEQEDGMTVQTLSYQSFDRVSSGWLQSKIITG